MNPNQIATSKSLSISVLKDKLSDMRSVYEHVFSTRIYFSKKIENTESNQWLLEINCRMLDLQETIFELENQ